LVKKTLILFLSLLLLASCAIHDKFPFICFRWSCIASELKLPSVNTSAMKKQRKAKASLRKKKRQRAKNKRLREKGITNSSDYVETQEVEQKQEESKPTKDSVHYSFKTPSDDKFIIIKFFRINPTSTDSVSIRYPDKGSDISYYDKQILKSYLDSSNTKEISIVHVREHIGSTKNNQHQNKQVTPLKRRIGDYFIELGIPSEKIELK
jgi:hypothetical protein